MRTGGRFGFQWARLHPDARALICLACLCGLAYLPPLVAVCFGAWPFGDDALAAMVPWRELTREAFRHGVLPLWNPHLFCGMAFMSNGQSSVLYPPNLVYSVLSLKPALLVDALSHNTLLAFGTYTLARSLRLSRLAACFVASAYALSSVVSAHIYAGHTTWHAARAFLPWALWALFQYLSTTQRVYLLILAGVLGLQSVSGSPPVTLLTAALCAGLGSAWWLSRFTERALKVLGPSPNLFRGAARLSSSPFGGGRVGVFLLPPGWVGAVAITGVLTALLCAVQLLPLRELSQLTVHGTGFSFQEASAFSGTWRTFFKIVAPGFFGGTADLQWSTLGEAHEEAAYIGLLAVLMALAAPLLAKRRCMSPASEPTAVLPRPVGWLWALLPLTAVLALGRHTPVYYWLYQHSSLLRMLRLPTRWLEIWCLAGALLAGFAFDGCRDSLMDAASRNEAAGVVADVSNVRRLMTSLWMVAGLFAVLGVGLLLTAASATIWTQPARDLLRQVTTGDQLNVAEVAARFRSMAIVESFTVCLLASLGASLWRRWRIAETAPQRKRVELIIVAFVALDGLFSFWRYPHIVPAPHDQKYLSWPPALTRLYRPEQRWSTRLLWVAVNGGERSAIDLFNGYEPMSTRRFFAFAQAVEGRDFWDGVYQPEHYPPLLRVAGVTHTLSQAGVPLGNDADRLQPVAAAGEWKLWRQPEPWPRVYLSRKVVHLTETAQLSLLNALATQPFAQGGQPVVANPAVCNDIAATPLTQQDRVIAWRRGFNEMTTVTATGAPSVLVQAEAWYPGWRAWVNGRPARVERVNYMFRGIRVPAGTAGIQVVYEPQTYRFAVFLTLCGLAAAAAWWCVWAYGQRRPSGAGAS